jgi:hypothetical protein
MYCILYNSFSESIHICRLYSAEEVVVPSYVPDTPASREDIAAQYTAISRWISLSQISKVKWKIILVHPFPSFLTVMNWCTV